MCDWSEHQHQLRSEHGYSLVLTVQHNGQRDSILYDAGLGRDTAINNMDLLGINPVIFVRWSFRIDMPTITRASKACSVVSVERGRR